MAKKKPTKQEIGAAFVRLIHARRTGKPPVKVRKDESIATKPIVPCPDIPEKDVVKACMKWLVRHRIFANRHDVGGGYLGAGTAYATYGIQGAGDIIGLLPDGTHFELEIKRGRGGNLSKKQRKRMKDIRDNSGIYLVIHGIPELEHYNTIFFLTSRRDYGIVEE